MPARRFVLLGLPADGSSWVPVVEEVLASRDVGDEFLACEGRTDLLTRLGTGRRFSAALVDQRTVGLDREFVRRANAADCPVILIGGPADPTRGASLGLAAHLPDPVTGSDLARALEAHAAPIGRVDDLRLGSDDGSQRSARWTGRLVAVTGSGGTGASSVARGLAAGLAGDPRLGGEVLLIDACLEADQAHLHGVEDPTVDLQGATQAHRSGDPPGNALDDLVLSPPGHHHRLLPGIRRRRDWPSIGGPTLAATLRNLRDHHLATVVDVDPDVDLGPTHQPVGPATPGEPARVVLGLADLVLVVGRPPDGDREDRATRRVLENLSDARVPDDRIVVLRVARAGLTPPRRRPGSRFRTARLRRNDPHALPLDDERILDLHSPIGEPATTEALAIRVLSLLDRLPTRPAPVDDVAVAAGTLGTTRDAT